MSFLRKLDLAANGPLLGEPWTASPSEAQAEFADWVNITRLGAIPPERANAYLAERFAAFQQPENSMRH